MHRTKLSPIWFWAAHLMATHSNGMSAQQLGATLALLQHGLAAGAKTAAVDGGPGARTIGRRRRGRPDRDSADNSFFEITKTGKIRHRCRRGHQSRLGRKYLDTLSGRIRLAAIPGNHAPHIHAFIKANIAPGATLITDGHASYLGLADYRTIPASSATWRRTSPSSGSIGCSLS